MAYLIFGAIVLILIVLLLQYSNKRKSNKKIEQIRLAWGKPKKEKFYFESISKLANTIREKRFHQLSEQTIRDIDFHDLFTFIDRTTSKVGQQYLFKKLIQPTNDLEDKSKQFIEVFTANTQLREDIQLELLKLSGDNAYYVSSLLQDKLLDRPAWLKFLILDLMIVITLLIFSFSYPVLVLTLIVLFAINMFLHFWNKNNTFQFIRSFPQLSVLINVSENISKKDSLFSNALVNESISNLKSFQRKASLISLDNDVGIQGELSQLGSYFFELIKAFFLIEIFALFQIVKELEARKSSILILFNYVGDIDTSVSVASLRGGSLKTCQPTFLNTKKELIAKNLYHPLLKNCTKNDLTINGKSVLITGSNMSGKSTFLRTLAINTILAQTIYTCFADEFTLPILKLFSSIRTEDNLLEGTSYYLQEVNTMASLINEVASTHQNLFIVDEVFKGTNTIERIASAKAILSYLNQSKNIVIVSTHDIELSAMLELEYDLYHFTETIENGMLHFDHQIKVGPLKTRNAIKLLELSNYPAEIISEATRLTTTLKGLQK
jgi:DNA mismatch repair ATPase MutS